METAATANSSQDSELEGEEPSTSDNTKEVGDWSSSAVTLSPKSFDDSRVGEHNNAFRDCQVPADFFKVVMDFARHLLQKQSVFSVTYQRKIGMRRVTTKSTKAVALVLRECRS
ncbi:hypothetical protein KIN20_015793 [Parelaphostrongylus tenuis]|uniref:Uncharacterized protein n=1 Tax=Parelaphostrongylus tenuis TaxID=148309 RepID=A0AAD5QPA4_PARTN|nr:hypothetical protein KIN20_015793 [Parelaphostrongylus tenuis]